MLGDVLYYIFIILMYAIFIGGPILAVYWIYQITRQKKKIDFLKDKQYVIFKLLVPKNNEKTPLAAEQMFASLHGIHKPRSAFQDHISFEIISRDRYIEFFVRTPIHLKDFVEGQIYAQYPHVEIIETEDYVHLEPDLKIAMAPLQTNKPDPYPFKTFESFEVDPLSAITSTLSKVKLDEEIWIQILVKPVDDIWRTKGISLINQIRSGSGAGTIAGEIKNVFFGLAKDILKEITTLAPSKPTAAPVSAGAKQLSNHEESAITGIEEKVKELGFQTKVRIAALSKDEETARSKVQMVFGTFKQFNTNHLNGYNLGPVITGEEAAATYGARAFPDSGFILNIKELSSIFHLPNVSVETPMIVWAGSKKGEPPSNLPVESSMPSDELTLFAETNFRNVEQKFGIKSVDRRLHMYAIGKTGTGKSTMLENMIIHDIREGKGLAVVDPHGDLIKHILDFIPAERINDVVYFAPADRDWPVAFNVLENVDPDLRNIVASGVVGIFKKIFGESWGPRLEYILRNSVLSLLDFPQSTLLGINKVLVDRNFRKKVVEIVKDPVIKDFWIHEYEKYDERFRNEAIAPIQNKVGQFLSSTTIRNIVGQPKSTIDIEEIMNQGKIFLVDLSIGKIGEDNSALLGSMIITKIQLAAMGRARIPEEERRDFYLYVDEFQNFATDSFAVILSEARKYHLNLIMTNQYTAQMPEVVANAVFGNVGTMISFRVGAADADALVKEFEPVFEANDMVNLGNYHVYVKMAIDGVTCPAFSALTLSPVSGGNQNQEKIIKVSRERYARSREEVEEKIQEWADSGGGFGDSKPEAKVSTFGTERAIIKEKNIVNVEDKNFHVVKGEKGDWYLEIEKEDSQVKNLPDENSKIKEEEKKESSHKTGTKELKEGEETKV